MSKNMVSKNVYIDPSYEAFYGDKLFDLSNPNLNRDDQLLPFVRMRDEAAKSGMTVKTADFLSAESSSGKGGDYYSMGILPDYESLKAKGVTAQAYILLEPPVVAPKFYQNLPSLTANFKSVYVHNTHGDGYSLEGVRKEVLKKIYWPLPYKGVLEKFWNRRERKSRIVVINGHHKPISSKNELYSKRIEAIAALEKYDIVDLFGRGWDKWLTRCSLWLPYLLNRSALLKAYRGACGSKYETLSEYNFCLCFENMKMSGYITEKIFDCLYAGTIPLYLGAPDIEKYIPTEAFVDCRKFSNWNEMLNFVRAMTPEQIQSMREAGRAFFESERARPYYHSLENIIGAKGE
ncbi:glycosyltransferase family 10 domain-containing protein [Bdellovibrio sp. HCB337]|uniref:glycosyltransferase family 10 domain-containing protein n=1 Tax=Bdellovibrio sp. HCB337 TaxID=3394358 RepID=UPI0039A706F8